MSRVPFLVLALFAATLLAYAPALRGGFIWNDSEYVTAPALRSAAGLARIWFELGATEQYYPFLHSAFWVEHRLWGDSAAGYHLLNVLLHAASACLLAGVLRRLAVPGAWLAAFLWALHPVCVESVAWISEQKNTLSLLFYLWAALLYLRFDDERGPRQWWAATALFAVGLLTKSVTATLPAALLVGLWWRRGRIELRRDVAPLLPWFAIGAAMGLVSAWVEKTYLGAQGSEFALTFLQRALLAGRITWFYLGKLFWPAELIFIYPRWRIDPTAAWQWIFLLAVAVTIAGLWRWRRHSRAPLAAALFFGGSLFPVLGFFNVYAFIFSFVADHWQYLPSIGVFAAVAAGWATWRRGLGAGFSRVVPVMVVAALGSLTFHQSRMYADMRTFYRTTIARNPDAWMARNNLGNLLREEGDLTGAVEQLEAALRVRPDLSKVHNNLAACLHDLKRPPEALAHYQRAVELDPKYAEAHNRLGSVLREAGRLDEARDHLQSALRLDPALADARNNLGMVLREQGRLSEALQEFQRFVRESPDSAPGRLNLALTLSLLGRAAEAMEQFSEARRLNPGIPDGR